MGKNEACFLWLIRCDPAYLTKEQYMYTRSYRADPGAGPKVILKGLFFPRPKMSGPESCLIIFAGKGLPNRFSFHQETLILPQRDQFAYLLYEIRQSKGNESYEKAQELMNDRAFFMPQWCSFVDLSRWCRHDLPVHRIRQLQVMNKSSHLLLRIEMTKNWDQWPAVFWWSSQLLLLARMVFCCMRTAGVYPESYQWTVGQDCCLGRRNFFRMLWRSTARGARCWVFPPRKAASGELVDR